jgi:hypothetical protein
MSGPKRIPVYDPVTGAIEDHLLTGILDFVPAKAHLYRVFAVGREHERELALAARAALEAAGHQPASVDEPLTPAVPTTEPRWWPYFALTFAVQPAGCGGDGHPSSG